MRIKSIELHNVRGVKHLRTENLPETGVIVIHGPNEAGKSTIADAIRIVLTEKASAKTKPNSPKARNSDIPHRGTQWLQSVHSDKAPEVTLDLTVGPYEFRIHKRWIKTPETELTIFAPQRASLTGEEAENQLQAILEQHLDAKLLNALFLQQDQLDTAIVASGLPSLERVLTATTGAKSRSSEEDTVLMQRVEAEYSRYFTDKTGRPAKELKDAQTREKDAAQVLRDAQQAQQALDGNVEQYSRAMADRDKAAAALPGALESLAERHAAAKSAQELLDSVEAQREKLALAQREDERAREDLMRREELSQQVAAAQEALEHTAAELEEAAAKNEQESAALENLQAAVDEAREHRAQARRAVRAAKQAVRAIEAREDLTRLQDKVTALEGLQAAVDGANKLAAARGRIIQDADVEAVESANNSLQVALSLKEQAAAKLIFHPADTAEVTVSSTSQVLPAGQDTVLALDATTDLVIGSIPVRFEPGAQGKDLVQKVADAQELLDELLEELDCSSVEQVRSRRVEHQEIDHRLRAAKAELKKALGNDSLSALRAELQAARERVEATVQACQSADAATVTAGGEAVELGADQTADQIVDPAGEKPGEPVLDKAAAQEAELAAEEASAQSEAALENAEAKLAPLQKRPAFVALATAQQAHEQAEVQLKRAEEALAAAEKALPGEELAQKTQRAAALVAELKEAVATAEATLRETDVQQVQNLFEGAQEKVSSLRKRKDAAENTMNSLKLVIEQAEGAAEKLRNAESSWEAAKAVLASTQQRAEAAKLLYTTMVVHRDAARKRYAAPYAAELSTLASAIFGPDVEFGLNEELEIVNRSQGETTVPLEDLSGGAREQLALITRFAIAQLVARGSEEQSVPVLVDDALGSTDQHRLDLIAAVFTQAAKNSQVIVLTCMPERYDSIPGKVEFDIEQLKQAPASTVL
ncbi:AAA family ATPase [Corynebacterium lizhenjunii]|uniref:AAA family ATPase n=1 Tax=Corynebacterium lizhenjunii TaxID=2709394 RepID=UPI0013EA974C|nr:AAA family ATPase [Corynebacterium lizhenjunii]